MLKDQYIIDLSGISDYPSSLLNPSSKIKQRLNKSIFIKDAKVYKKNLYKIYIRQQLGRTLYRGT